MKPGTKLAILLISCVAMWGGIGYAFHYFGQPSKRAQSVAEKALMASVDNPESVKVIAVSKPDSVFGRNYINNDEKMAIAMSMMKVNEQVMSRTDGLQNLDFEDNCAFGSQHAKKYLQPEMYHPALGVEPFLVAEIVHYGYP